jgi:hypothetical protein
MYPEEPYPSRLLYSIYTGREAQCNITNNYTQSIPPTILNGGSTKILNIKYGIILGGSLYFNEQDLLLKIEVYKIKGNY